MAEEKGFRSILKLNLPPIAAYHSGHSWILQGDTIGEVKELLAEQLGEEHADFVVAQFFENVQISAVEDALQGGNVAHEAAAVVKPKEKTPNDGLSPMERAKALAKSKRGAK